jgi:uncharacterized protein
VTELSDTAVVQSFLGSYQRKDPGAAIALIDPDISVSEPDGLIYGGEHHGRDAFIADVLQSIAEHYEVDIKQFRTVDATDVTIAIIDARWTSTATGRSLDTRFCEIYTTRNGLITSIEVIPKDSRALYELTLPVASVEA